MENPKSISVFIKDNNVIDIVPSLYTDIGFGMQTEYYQELQPPYDVEHIGELFLLAWNETKDCQIICRASAKDIIPAFQLISGKKSYLSFQKNRQLIYVNIQENLIFQYWYRQKRGFGIDAGDKIFQRELPLDASAKQIGTAIAELYFEVNQKQLL